MSGFPSFAPLFLPPEGSTVPLYLELLNLVEMESSEAAVRAIRDAVSRSPNPGAEIAALLADFNWRPQLVGAVAMLTGVATRETLRALWEALDSGSWVSPQLAVTAFLTDPEFEAQARPRVESGCPIRRGKGASLLPVERHVAAGPGSLAAHSSKTLAALANLCCQVPEATAWLDVALMDEHIQRLLAGDSDQGDRVAASWIQRIGAVLDRPDPPSAGPHSCPSV